MAPRPRPVGGMVDPAIYGAEGGAMGPGQGAQQPLGAQGQWVWGGAPTGGAGGQGVPGANVSAGLPSERTQDGMEGSEPAVGDFMQTPRRGQVKDQWAPRDIRGRQQLAAVEPTIRALRPRPGQVG